MNDDFGMFQSLGASTSFSQRCCMEVFDEAELRQDQQDEDEGEVDILAPFCFIYVIKACPLALAAPLLPDPTSSIEVHGVGTEGD